MSGKTLRGSSCFPLAPLSLVLSFLGVCMGEVGGVWSGAMLAVWFNNPS